MNDIKLDNVLWATISSRLLSSTCAIDGASRGCMENVLKDDSMVDICTLKSKNPDCWYWSRS